LVVKNGWISLSRLTDVAPNRTGHAPHIRGWGFEILSVQVNNSALITFLFPSEALAVKHRAAVVQLVEDATDLAVG